MQHAIGEYMPAFRIDTDLRLVDRDKGKFAVHRHRFGSAQKPLRVLRDDLFLAGDQRHPVGALERHHPVIDFPRQQAQRKTDHPARMGTHALDGKMGFAGIGRAENGDKRRLGKPGHCSHNSRSGGELQGACAKSGEADRITVILHGSPHVQTHSGGLI